VTFLRHEIPEAIMPRRALYLPVQTWAFLAIGAASALTHHPHRAPATEPRSPAEVLARLRERGLALYVVPVSLNSPDPDGGVYLCDRERSWEDLSCLGRGEAWAPRWKGVVHLGRGTMNEVLEVSLTEWGLNAAYVGGVVLFGDPVLIERVRAALGE
jgi:hypothetical protein